MKDLLRSNHGESVVVVLDDAAGTTIVGTLLAATASGIKVVHAALQSGPDPDARAPIQGTVAIPARQIAWVQVLDGGWA